MIMGRGGANGASSTRDLLEQSLFDPLMIEKLAFIFPDARLV